MIPQNRDISSLEDSAIQGLLKAAKCLCKELDNFRQSIPNSLE